MPKRILILGILFCIAGMLAIFNIVAAFAVGRLHFDLTAFMLPAGALAFCYALDALLRQIHRLL
ncbi:hypothetical protein DB346_20275 [Verrucomicrobia bacterium LW23]|nr:hypothetical protein DB346_20275 [Verrucomicrobia bacterium LW23]